jgi:hypothetical protein
VKDERTPAENLAKALTCGLCPEKTDHAFVKALVAVAYLSSFNVSTVNDWMNEEVGRKRKVVTSLPAGLVVFVRRGLPGSALSRFH